MKSSSGASRAGCQSTFTVSLSSAYDFLVSISSWVRSVQAGQCQSSLFSAACLAAGEQAAQVSQTFPKVNALACIITLRHIVKVFFFLWMLLADWAPSSKFGWQQLSNFWLLEDLGKGSVFAALEQG